MSTNAFPTVAHISDLHIGWNKESVDRAETVIQYLQVNAGAFDAVLVTGDIAHGRDYDAEYLVAERLLRFDIPMLMVPGNHDDKQKLKETFALSSSDASLHSYLKAGSFSVISIDTAVQGEDFGLVTDETIQWLRDCLQKIGDSPTMIATHHHPVPCGIEALDKIKLFRSDELADEIASHPNIIAIVCGHIHMAMSARFANRHFVSAPGVVSTAVLPWEEQSTMTQGESSPGFAIHVMDPSNPRTQFRYF